MEVILFVRQDVDWNKLSRQQFYMQDSSSPVWKILKSEISLLEFWDSLFSIPFLDFRSQMKSMAQQQNSLTRCQIIRGEKELKKEMDKTNDAYILPVDDDDFFSPEIKQLEELSENSGVVLWPEGWLLGSKAYRTRPPRRGVGTNAYAIKKSMLKEKIPKNKWHYLLRYHGVVSRTICPDGTTQDFLNQATHIDKPLSVSNRHIGTITLWQNTIYQNNPEDYRTQILKRYYEMLGSSQSTGDYSWCQKIGDINTRAHFNLFSPKLFKYLIPPNDWKGKFPLFQ